MYLSSLIARSAIVVREFYATLGILVNEMAGRSRALSVAALFDNT